MEFSEWMTKKYNKWRGEAYGHEKSVTEYAEEYIGVPQQVMSDWMKGKTKPKSARAIHKLAAKYGNEVYEILSLPPPDGYNYSREWKKMIDLTPPEYQDEILEIYRHWLREKGIDYE